MSDYDFTVLVGGEEIKSVDIKDISANPNFVASDNPEIPTLPKPLLFPEDLE